MTEMAPKRKSGYVVGDVNDTYRLELPLAQSFNVHTYGRGIYNVDVQKVRHG
jgi:hypothetical protein